MNIHNTHNYEKGSSLSAAADGDNDDQESHSTEQTQKASNLTVSKREVEASRQIVRAYLDVAIDTLNRGRFEALNGIVSLRAVQNPMARARTFEEATDLLRDHQDELLPENHFLRARFNEFLQHALVLAPPPNASLEARYNDFWIQERRRVGERRSSDAGQAIRANDAAQAGAFNQGGQASGTDQGVDGREQAGEVQQAARAAQAEAFNQGGQAGGAGQEIGERDPFGETAQAIQASGEPHRGRRHSPQGWNALTGRRARTRSMGPDFSFPEEPSLKRPRRRK